MKRVKRGFFENQLLKNVKRSTSTNKKAHNLQNSKICSQQFVWDINLHNISKNEINWMKIVGVGILVLL